MWFNGWLCDLAPVAAAACGRSRLYVRLLWSGAHGQGLSASRRTVSDSEVASDGGRVSGLEGERAEGRRAGALHLGVDLLVRSLERQVAATAAAVVHRTPWCLCHLSNGEVDFCASCVERRGRWGAGAGTDAGAGKVSWDSVRCERAVMLWRRPAADLGS